MQIQNEYIGDDKFTKLLEHYNCSAPLSVIKLRFIGAMCSPNLDLRPADVISSFWEEGKDPRLSTKEEADLFFKFFMGLWDKLFEDIKNNKVTLSRLPLGSKDDVLSSLRIRYAEVELGFVEGFWGGKSDYKLPAYLAQMVDSLSELALVYKSLAKQVEVSGKVTDEILENISYTDKMVVKAISFIVDNFVLPRIDDVARTIN